MVSWYTTAVPRPMLVATAAPVTPSAGDGPRPKMKHGPSRMFRRFPNQSARIASAASPVLPAEHALAKPPPLEALAQPGRWFMLP